MATRPTKADVDAAYKSGYTAGFERGLARGKQEAEELLYVKRIEAFVKLVNSVGQTLDTQSRLVQGLASALDNAGVLR